MHFANVKRVQAELSTLLNDLQTLPTGLRDSLSSIAEDHGGLLAQLARVSVQEVQEVLEEVSFSLMLNEGGAPTEARVALQLASHKPKRAFNSGRSANEQKPESTRSRAPVGFESSRELLASLATTIPIPLV